MLSIIDGQSKKCIWIFPYFIPQCYKDLLRYIKKDSKNTVRMVSITISEKVVQYIYRNEEILRLS